MQGVGVMLLICVSIGVAPGHACSPPQFWRPMSFQDRLAEARIVFSGRVTSSTAPSSGRGMYQATFQVDCFYKGLIDYGPETVTVGGIGWDYGLCTATSVAEGNDYVIFANMGGEGLEVSNINVQSGVTEARPGVLAEVAQGNPCVKPRGPLVN